MASGEDTIEAHVAPHGRKLYGSWFCPYVQRAFGEERGREGTFS